MVSPDLIKYIKAQKVSGKDEYAIRQELVTAGWQESAINEAFAEVNAPPPPTRVVPPPEEPRPFENTPIAKVMEILNPILRRPKTLLTIIGGLLLVVVLITALPGVIKIFSELGAGGKKPENEVTELTPDQLDKLFKKAINSKELEFNGAGTTDYVGCSLSDEFKGVMYGENKQFRYVSNYKEGTNPNSCLAVNAGQSYSEGYWIEDDVFYRNSETDSLAKIIDATENTGQKPTTFLTRLFGDNNGVEIISSSVADRSVNAKVKMETATASQELEITASGVNGDIQKVKYTQNLKGFPVGEAVSKGEIVFQRFTVPVALPPFAPSQADFLKDAFVDISSFSPLGYSVDTLEYSIHPSKDMMDGDYPIDVVLGEGESAVTNSCPVGDERCLQKGAELREMFNLLTPFINVAQSATCQKREVEQIEPESGPAIEQVIPRAEMYGGRLSVLMHNKYRNTNPEQTGDYTFLATIYLDGDRKNEFDIRAKLGQEFCFNGAAEEVWVSDLYNRFDTFQQDVRNIVAAPMVVHVEPSPLEEF